MAKRILDFSGLTLSGRILCRRGRKHGWRLFVMLLAASVILAVPGAAQQAPAVSSPATPAPGTPASVPTPSPPAPAPPAPAPPVEAAKPAEPPKEPPKDFPKSATDAGGGEMREIEARPVLRLKGKSTWDDGFVALKKTIATLETEAKRLNLPTVGNAMAYFVDSDDLGFTFEGMLPLGASPSPDTAFGKEFDAVQSPAGRAVVFSHEGAYDEVDTAYEALTAWLDDKNLVSTGKFLEEYEFIPEKSDETTLKLKIVVFLK